MITPLEGNVGRVRHGQLAHWSDLVPGDLIEVLYSTLERDRGVVDCVGHEGTLVWVQLQRAGHRTLLHQPDGIQIFYS